MGKFVFVFTLAQNYLLDLIFVGFNEFPKGTVISFFDVVWKKTGRQLLHLPVILETLTANAFAAAGLPGTVASFQVFWLLTFFHDWLHFSYLFSSDFPVRLFPGISFLIKIIGQSPAQSFCR